MFALAIIRMSDYNYDNMVYRMWTSLIINSRHGF